MLMMTPPSSCRAKISAACHEASVVPRRSTAINRSSFSIRHSDVPCPASIPPPPLLIHTPAPQASHSPGQPFTESPNHQITKSPNPQTTDDTVAAMQLLVSVANGAEASAALAGGADIVDAKNPGAGALGAVSHDALTDIHRAVAGARPAT